MVGLSGPLMAQSNGFDPRAPCGATLRTANDTDKLLIAAWVSGYVASKDRDARPVDRASMVTTLKNLFQACGRDEQRSLVALMRGHEQGSADVPGSKAHATRFLKQFLDPGADLAALTAGMVPTRTDIAALYKEPLAGRLAEMYTQMFTPGARIGPKPEHNALIVIRATTGALKTREAVLREFPGGYRRVVDEMIGDLPIVRFKFVTRGETLGLAFDGLIHVNGRWVLMPKPWRALE